MKKILTIAAIIALFGSCAKDAMNERNAFPAVAGPATRATKDDIKVAVTIEVNDVDPRNVMSWEVNGE